MFTVCVFSRTHEVSLIKALEQYGLFLYTFSSPQTILTHISSVDQAVVLYLLFIKNNPQS